MFSIDEVQDVLAQKVLIGLALMVLILMWLTVLLIELKIVLTSLFSHGLLALCLLWRRKCLFSQR